MRWIDTPEKGRMENNYNRKKDVRTLKPLKNGDQVRIKPDQGKSWDSIGIITAVDHKNRNYSFQTNVGISGAIGNIFIMLERNQSTNQGGNVHQQNPNSRIWPKEVKLKLRTHKKAHVRTTHLVRSYLRRGMVG